MTFFVGLLIGLSVGSILGVFIFGILSAASRGEAMVYFEDATADPYDFDHRQRRVDRALERENNVPLKRAGASPQRPPA